jgi:hypothetical protein
MLKGMRHQMSDMLQLVVNVRNTQAQSNAATYVRYASACRDRASDST